MTGRTHNICEECWEGRYPGRMATRIGEKYRRQTFCCFCAIVNFDGIWVREDPASSNFSIAHATFHALNEQDD